MARVWTGMFATVTVSLLAVGCQNKVYDENQALRKQNQELQTQLDANRRPEPVIQQPVASAPISAPVQQSPVQQVAEDPASSEPKTAPRPKTDLGNLEVTHDERAGTTTVSLPGDLFFDSGRVTLKESAKKSLDKVVMALKKDYARKKIRIEGHTDSDPIVHSKWKSNQELSERRAEAVKEYLVSKGISSSRVTTVGMGDAKPRSTHDKAKNRRVEVVVLTRSE